MKTLKNTNYKIIILLITYSTFISCGKNYISKEDIKISPIDIKDIGHIKNNPEKLSMATFKGLDKIRIENVEFFKRLKTGKLTDGSKININQEVIQCKTLTINTELESLKGIEEFTNLEELIVKTIKKDDFKYLKKLNKLKAITISYSIFSEVPSFVFILPNLEELNIENSIVGVFSSLSNLIKIKRLRINHTDLSWIPNLSKLSNLEYLDLNNNFIESFLSFDNFNPSNLKSIDLSYNKINTAVPKIIVDDFQNLQSIRLKGNKIKDYSKLKPVLKTDIKLDIKSSNILKK